MLRIFNRTTLVAAFGLATVFANVSAHADVGCRSKANAAADEWANGRIAPAADTEVPPSDTIVVIAYGKKYFVPRNMPHDENGRLPELGQLASDRTLVYEQEKASCLNLHHKKYYIYPN